VRLSGKRPALCEVCNLRRHTRLCDALEPGQASRNKTCDIKLCEGCTTSSGKQDFCPKHKELA
jgi:hypothetical protein